MSKFVIRVPTADELPDVYEMRFRLLREPWSQPRGSEQSPEDDTQAHLAAFENNVLVATARLDDLGEGRAQIRCVAVSSACQGKGYGSSLMREMEQLAWNMGFTELTLHARVNAVMFYHRLGYTFVSPSYNLWNQIQHYEMRKSKVSTVPKQESGSSNQSDQDLYAILSKCLVETSVDATKALVDLFIQDIVKKNNTIKETINTTPSNDGKVNFKAPQ